MTTPLPLKAPSFVIYPDQNIAQAAADRLGKLKAELAPLLNEEEALKEILRHSGESVVEGREYRATISPSGNTTKVDWKGLASNAISAARLAKLLPAWSSSSISKGTVKVVAKQGV